jgi:quercetin 2,3-dioxygenase
MFAASKGFRSKNLPNFFNLNTESNGGISEAKSFSVRPGGLHMSIRPVKRISQSVLTMEGAGVRLRRAFGFGDTSDFDPFLIMDDFRGDRPEDYLAGFPWHPHRGIETITYVLAGSVDHGDSLGNRGKLGSGDVQWMTAGSGILHQEMPTGDVKGRMHGFQLWANLPAHLKMVKPRYQDVPATEIPEVIDDDGTRVRIICGEFWGKTGPVDGVAAEPRYLDVTVPAGKKKRLKVEDFRQAFAYIFEGSAVFAGSSEPFGVLREAQIDGEEVLVRDKVGNRSLVVFGGGDEVVVQAGEEGVRFLLISGRPLREPIAWHGPIVMNTQDQIRQALSDLRSGAFIKN